MSDETTSGTAGPTAGTRLSRFPRSGSSAVGAGIVLSRLSGLVRESVIAHVLGVGVATDAFRNAVRIPNVLQNLLGEGSLSASFIPVYAGLLERDDPREARRLAGAVFGGLMALTGILVVVGVGAAGALARIIAPGAPPATRELTIELLRVTTVGVGFLVLSAWCLGILNSHRRFFVSYVAPVVWNAAQIVALVAA
ncbi:MAG: murein biosynthesis integral membrane protein MurJ, partial [Actinomyces sp.]